MQGLFVAQKSWNVIPHVFSARIVYKSNDKNFMGK